MLKLVAKEKLQVHWLGSKKLDAGYSLEYKKGAARRKAVPHTAVVWTHTVIDHVTLGKGGKLDKGELERILLLVRQSDPKSS